MTKFVNKYFYLYVFFVTLVIIFGEPTNRLPSWFNAIWFTSVGVVMVMDLIKWLIEWHLK